MSEKVSILIFMLVLSLVLVSSPQSLVVKAEPKTIVVPDDYTSIVDAVGNATDGDTVFIKKGTYKIEPTNPSSSNYSHSISINKSISIHGEDEKETIISFQRTYFHPIETMIPTKGFLVNANNFVISNLTVQNCVYGVYVTGNQTLVKNVNSTMYIIGNNCEILENSLNTWGVQKWIILVDGSKNKIANNHANFITCRGTNNHIIENDAYGLMEITGETNFISKNRCVEIHLAKSNFNTIWNNSFGYIYLKDSNNNTICGNTLEGGRFKGIFMFSGSGNAFYSNLIANHQSGVIIGQYAEDNLFYHNNFINNTKSVSFNVASNLTNYWDNGFEGNYWSDYSGTVTSGNGIGDTPYIIDEENQDNYPLFDPKKIAISEVPPGSGLLFGEKKFQVHDTHDFYYVTIGSNSTVYDFYFFYDLMRISFYVSGTAGTTGLCNVTIPAEFMSTGFSVFKDEKPLTKNTDYTQTFNGTHYLFTITYDHSNHLIQIYANNNIPEFPSGFILVFFTGVCLAIVLVKTKRKQIL